MEDGRDALRIDGLSVVYETEQGNLPAVRSVSLAIAPQQTLGLVGESGSGKTTLALGAIGYLPAGGRVVSGSTRLKDTELTALSRREMRNVWGSRIGLVSQNPLGALNPALTIGRQLDEVGRRHLGLDRRDARDLTLTMLRRVDMPDPRSVVRRYPHQLSGGMLQRSAIAMALSTNPELLILDEPTTALDATTQAMVLELLDELKAEFKSAILYITHNLGVVSRICDRVAIMYAGEIFEVAEVAELFRRPLHPYTLNLLNCVPHFRGRGLESSHLVGQDGQPVGHTRAQGSMGPGMRLSTIPGSLPRLDELPGGCTFAPRCSLAVEACRASRPPLIEVREAHSTACLRWEMLLREDGRQAAIARDEKSGVESLVTGAGARRPDPDEPSVSYSTGRREPGSHLLHARDIVKAFVSRGGRTRVHALDGVSVWIDGGRTLGLVGESGSGKTTLARALTGLSAPSRGRVAIDGIPVGPTTADRNREMLSRLQMVFQNPEASLNPRRTVGQEIIRPLLTLRSLDRRTATAWARRLLEAVRLPASYYERYPGELSGGEKQRVAIARAFAANPDLVVCDEPISSLDVSVQGSLMNLLADLQEVRDTAYLFISHDVAVVEHLSHRIAVMYLGLLVEEGEATRVLAPPSHPYTEALLSAVPIPNPEAPRTPVRFRSGTVSSVEIPPGCRFHPRCPRFLGAICEQVDPPWLGPAGVDHSIRCHIPPDELAVLQEP